MVREQFPNVRLIINTANLGFAAATNQGLRIAQGRYALLLNSDTELPPDAITKMLGFMDHNPLAGALGPQLCYSDGRLQLTAKRFPNFWSALFGRKSIFTRWLPNNPISRTYLLELGEKHNEPFEADCLSGACLLVRKEVIERIGLLDEDFFMYWEDNDWCFRIKKSGWKIFVLPTVRVIHHEGQSSGGHPAKHIIAFHRSAYHYACKHLVKSQWDIRRWVIWSALVTRALMVLSWAELRWAFYQFKIKVS